MIRMTTSRIRRVIGVTSLTASLVVSMGAVASFAEPKVDELIDVATLGESPALMAGNPGCGWFTGDGETAFTEMTKFNEPGDGWEAGDTLGPQAGITLTVVDVKDNGEIVEFDWVYTPPTEDSPEGVTMVIVKASPAANLYVYNPPATSDTGLVSVTNDQGLHGVSHVTFCAGDIPDDGGDDPDPNIAPAASATGSCTAGVVVTLDNSATDDDDESETYTTTYSVVVNVNDAEVHDGTHNVDEGDTDQFTAVNTLAHGDKWDATISAEGMDTVEASGTAVCPPGKPDPEAAPAAAFNHVCTTDDAGVATVTLTNTGDADAEFTVVTEDAGSSNAQKVTVTPGGTEVESVPLSGSEVLSFLVTAGDGEWTYAADNDRCVTDVQGVVLENDPPTPNGSANPAPEPQVQGVQLAATGLESPDLLLLAMLFAGLGLALLLSTTKPDPLVVRTH